MTGSPTVVDDQTFFTPGAVLVSGAKAQSAMQTKNMAEREWDGTKKSDYYYYSISK